MENKNFLMMLFVYTCIGTFAISYFFIAIGFQQGGIIPIVFGTRLAMDLWKEIKKR